MRWWRRVARHTRLTLFNGVASGSSTPPFLVLFINSTCNQTCEHCFYWRNLNRNDDLTVDEIRVLSEDLGPLENLNVSGGEPFLRKEFAEICGYFIRNNGVKRIYVPTNGSFPERTAAALGQVFRYGGLDLFVVELSLEGLPPYHNSFRGMKDAFERAMATYEALAALQANEPRLRIHAVSTVTGENVGEVRRLSDYLFEHCPAIEHHGISLIRGDRKNPALTGPALDDYQQLYAYVRRLWHSRNQQRLGGFIEAMMQWAKARTVAENRQVVPCRAGVLTGVVYSNGDVSVCETHAPLGNLRQRNFSEIWQSGEAAALRRSIAAKECSCTNEVFLWPSITYQPFQLARALAAAKPWALRQDGVNATPAPTTEDPPKLRVLQ